MVCTVIWGVMTYCVLTDIFTIVPTTQYVWINRTATFTCAINISEHTVTFSIPSVDEDASLQTLPGGEQVATAAFIATLDTNGTNVTCGALDGFTVVTSTTAVQVFVQSKYMRLSYQIIITVLQLVGLPSIHNLNKSAVYSLAGSLHIYYQD